MKISDADVAAYRRDGAAVVRGVVSSEWVERMRVAIDELVENPPPLLDCAVGRGGSSTGTFMSRWNETVREFAGNQAFLDLASQMTGSRTIRLFYDQLFLREPQSDASTPLHQDLPYWPIAGRQIVSIWVPFDDASPTSGVVSYIQGSHQWNSLFKPVSFKTGSSADRQPSDVLPEIEEPERLIESSTVLTWELAPGDVLLHDPRTLHFARRNSSGDIRRRAIAFRYLGDDARWVNRTGHFLASDAHKQHLPHFAYNDGDALDHDELFPLLLP